MQSQRLSKELNFWGRKVHIHLGLFLLLFIWLFSFSGLLLNHGDWKISNFWDKRKETQIVTPIHASTSSDSSTRLKDIMSQLKIAGEISDVKMWPDSIYFRVSKPGEVRNMEVNFITGVCTQKELQYNLAGKIRTLHSFNGVDKNNPGRQPNWIITDIWRLSMDGIATGLLLLCISSWIMWFKIRERYRWGWFVLILGFGAAIYFIFVLRIL
ncbi:hypothetical protein FW778_21290 [Ginsengibacter hankyongi]|uniref:PepSY-associated TM region n=1 Tax=Ginsengibacter hankyongi TaxID=2607284 RepID=A0A5J5IAB3_9BACT|nr:PepSY-associated TM helix domain-containing protein [Ginsengibacter hankyongi]KAA9035496.1 hypothetical protein FW778_21290 [Ginsengibacter hankyongi]